MSKLRSSLVLVAALGLAAPALAQPGTQAGAKDNAPLKPAHTVNDGGARRGANSFTEGQARAHIAHSGYGNVSALTKDENGVWHGMARKGRHPVAVALDFKGNVTVTRAAR